MFKAIAVENMTLYIYRNKREQRFKKTIKIVNKIKQNTQKQVYKMGPSLDTLGAETWLIRGQHLCLCKLEVRP